VFICVLTYFVFYLYIFWRCNGVIYFKEMKEEKYNELIINVLGLDYKIRESNYE